MCASIKKLFVVAAFMLATSAQAGWFGADFSALVVQQVPQEPQATGRMYVGNGRVRTELQVNGQRRVEIHNPLQQRSWILFPDQRAYAEQRLRSSLGEPGENSANPCAGRPELGCQQMGVEEINGRTAVRWAVGNGQGTSASGFVWIDKEHGFPVRQVYGGIVTSELRYLGTATVEGRNTEKWEVSVRGEGGHVVKTLQWYDPALNIAIRQELPGGYVRQLRDIKVGPQPEHLFQVPTGYRQIPLPSGVRR